MCQLHLRGWITFVFLTGLLLAIFLIVQWTTPTTMASTTDALTVALDVAQAHGLKGDPAEMYIVRGRYSQLKPPSVAEGPDDSRNVLLVWLKAKYTYQSLNGHVFQADHTYVYIDTDTGEVFLEGGGPAPIKGLDLKPWQKVTKADIGKFPVPRKVSGSTNQTSSPQPTITPINP
jgi:hypothetical protein